MFGRLYTSHLTCLGFPIFGLQPKFSRPYECFEQGVNATDKRARFVFPLCWKNKAKLQKKCSFTCISVSNEQNYALHAEHP
jgi:hypothetical protein